jgi:8-amino-7-oxononanoate synthase
MAGFDSALYLGLGHGSAELRPWRWLTAGAPAALAPPVGSRAVARRLAALLGTEAATLGVSTLHLFLDLGGQLRRRPVRILADEHLYPVGRWGIERAAAGVMPAVDFRHHDAESLRRRLEARTSRRLPPLVITDGLCPDCGRVPPLDRYLELVEEHGGRLLVDDSQALGLLGWNPQPGRPYGTGGGGSPAFLGLSSPRLLLLSSLAKSFGAPLAVLAGSAAAVRSFDQESETLIYSSPPSVASIRAAEAALSINRERGDRLRARLAGLVRRFQSGLRGLGLSSGGLSPVQNLEVPAGVDPVDLDRRLKALGIQAVLQQGRCRPGPLLTFLLRTNHTPEEIDRALAMLARLVWRSRRNSHERTELRSHSR